MPRVLLLLLAALMGCAPTPEAPSGMSDLAAFFFREHALDDPASLGLGLTNLELLLANVDFDSEQSVDRAFAVDDLEDLDVDGVLRPDEPIADCIEVAVTARSPHSIDLHASLFVQADQVPAQTSTERYDRTFVTGEPACFEVGDCDRLSTSNDIRRANLVYTVDYVMPKEIMWLELVNAGGNPMGRRGMTARSWLDQSWTAENGQTRLVQSYTVEVWLEQNDGSTIRFEANYTDIELPGVDDEGTIRSTTRIGIDNAFTKNDEAIDELFGS